MKVVVLGSEWEIVESTPKEHKILKNCDGYCDYTIRRIVVDKMAREGRDDIELMNPALADNRVLRHELVHAFLYESGLADDSGWAKNEAMVDWIARQTPKLFKAFREADAI